MTAQTMTFEGLQIVYDQHVLQPRPWTAAQSHWAAELSAEAPSGPVLELFAGVGHIGLAAVGQTGRDLVLVDLNPAACELARRNIASAGMVPRVQVREGSIDEVLAADERFPVIIADPPWVPSSGVTEFPDDPTIAIDGGPDGLDLARAAAAVIDRHLAVGGSAVLQLGTVEQAEAVGRYLADELGSTVTIIATRQHERGVLVRLGR